MPENVFLRATFPIVTAALVLFSISASALAQSKTREVDVEHSSMTIHVFKTGLFSFAGDNHEIHAPLSSGKVDETRKMVEIKVESAKLTVVDPQLSASKRAQVQQEMSGQNVLDISRFPEIAFRSTQVREEKPSAWLVVGDLSLHGQTHSVTIRVNGRDGHYRGTFTLRQTDFGITPVSIAGGTVKVKDEVAIDFDIVTRQ